MFEKIGHSGIAPRSPASYTHRNLLHSGESVNIRLPIPRRSVASRGRTIYMKKIRPHVYPQEMGKVIVIDVRSGDYEVSTAPMDQVPAMDRLLERRPDALLWRKRVGYQTVAAFGGLRVDKDG